MAELSFGVETNFAGFLKSLDILLRNFSEDLIFNFGVGLIGKAITPLPF
jgi:hypothetical protein